MPKPKKVDKSISKPEPGRAAPDSLLGGPVEGYEGKYWHVKEGDNRPAGYLMSGAGIRVPYTLHIPTWSVCSYIKVYMTLVNGKKIVVWERYRDL